MKLRDHPLVNWPVAWVHNRSDRPKRRLNDIGTLTQVSRHNLAPGILFLVSSIDGDRYMGALCCRSIGFASQIYGILQAQVGRPIQEVGDLDISELL